METVSTLTVIQHVTCTHESYIQGTSYIITFIHTFSLFWASWMLGVTKLNPDWQYLKFPYQFLKIIYKLAGPLAWNSLPPKIKRTSLTLGQYLLWPAENWNVHSQLYTRQRSRHNFYYKDCVKHKFCNWTELNCIVSSNWPKKRKSG